MEDLGNGGAGISGVTGNLDAITPSIRATNVNDAPSVNNLTHRDYTKNATITLDTDVNLVDPEPNLYPNWSGAVLTIGGTGRQPAGRVWSYGVWHDGRELPGQQHPHRHHGRRHLRQHGRHAGRLRNNNANATC